MKRIQILKTCLTVYCLCAVVVLFGCAFSLFPQPGALAKKDVIIPLIAGETSKGSVATDDLKLDYELHYDGQDFTLNEIVNVDRSITDSFNRVKSFVIKMSFLNEQGVVLENVDVTPNFSMLGAIDGTLTKKKSGVVPAGSKAVAFCWYGSFYAGIRDTTGSWDIHYFPFERQKH